MPDQNIIQLYDSLSIPVDKNELFAIAGNIDTPDFRSRVVWFNKLLDLDRSLGVGGFIPAYDGYDYSFWHLLKYDAVYRPIRYVYMDVCMAANPSGFSRDQAKNACAHIEETVLLYLTTKGIHVNPKSTLGRMLHSYASSFDSSLIQQMKTINETVYVRVKHDYDVGSSKTHLFSLDDSLMVYFIARKICVALLQECGAMKDIISEIKQQKFFGQTWYVSRRKE